MSSSYQKSASECHVVFLAQYLPLHFVSTMHKLARRVGRLTLLLSEPMDSSRDWQPDFEGLNVSVQRSWRFPIRHRHPLGFEENGRLLVPYSTIPDLIRLKPDVVIAVEAGARTLQAAALHQLGAKFRLIVQMRESESTAQSRGGIRQAVRRWLLPRVDRVFVNGQSGQRYISNLGVENSQIKIVPSGTDTDTFGRLVRVRPPGDDLRLLYVGQLIERKGILPFVQALAAAARQTSREVSLTLAGRGPLDEAIRAVRCPANLTLQFPGSVPYKDLPQLYSRMDAFVMPSLSDEWGLVVNEAMASGLPVFGSNGAQAVQEMVMHGFSGWRFDPENSSETRHSLDSLLQVDAETLAAMSAAAHRTAMYMSDDHAAQAMFSGIVEALALDPEHQTPAGRETVTTAKAQKS